jgi:hypothetical protein
MSGLQFQYDPAATFHVAPVLYRNPASCEFANPVFHGNGSVPVVGQPRHKFTVTFSNEQFCEMERINNRALFESYSM